MRNKGFTLVELLAVIAIMAVLLLIAVPVYTGVRGNINESVYETKVEKLSASAEAFAEENGKFVFSVEALIESGLLEADNELGVYMDPRTNRNMNCDIINVKYENNHYYSTIIENDTCIDEEELENLHGMVRLSLYRDNTKIEEIDDWVTGSEIEVRYELTDNYLDYEDNFEEVVWNGEEQKICTKENIADCKGYVITTGEIKNVVVSLEYKVIIDGIEFINTIRKNVNIDNQSPYVIQDSIVLNNDVSTQQRKRVEFDLSDGVGSGLKEYAIISTKDCNSNEYNTNKKDVSDTHITEYLDNGEYYICTEDIVGNRSSVIDSSNTITVSSIDTSKPVINSFTITSQSSTYKTAKVDVKINATDDGGKGNLQMCVSETGYLRNCSWEKLNESFTKDYTLDGNKRTLYLSIQDASGNISQRTAEYTPYRECSSTKKAITTSWTTCTKTCGGGTQERNYNQLDVNTNKVCSSGKDRQNCNTRDCCSKTEIYGYGNFGACSKACGGGLQYRDVYYRSVYDGRHCSTVTNGNSTSCNTMDCCSSTTKTYGSWGSCSVRCGSGKKTRTVTEKSAYQSNITCSTYTESAKCSKSCGGGGGGGGGSSCCSSASGVYDSSSGKYDSNSKSPSDYASNHPSSCSGPGC